jgi:hypothetical protein
MAGRARNGGPGILQNTGISGFTTQQQDSVILSGVDRVYAADIASAKITAGNKVMELLVDNSISPRLETVSRAFEKLRWLELSFRIAAKGGSTTSGGYIAAFIPDPLDSSTTFATLLGHKGAVSGKWWETQVVRAQLPAVDLYNSASGGDLRLHSPGRLVVFSDGAPSGDVTPLTVDVCWRCQLKMPGFETLAEVAGEFTSGASLWTVTGSEFLVPVKAATEAATDAVTVFGAGIKGVESLRLPFPIVVYTTDSTELAFYLLVKDGKISMYNDIGLDDKVKWKGNSSIVVPVGTLFQVFQIAPPTLKSRGGIGMPLSTLEDQRASCSEASSVQNLSATALLAELVDRLGILSREEQAKVANRSPSLTDSIELLNC